MGGVEGGGWGGGGGGESRNTETLTSTVAEEEGRIKQTKQNDRKKIFKKDNKLHFIAQQRGVCPN